MVKTRIALVAVGLTAVFVTIVGSAFVGLKALTGSADAAVGVLLLLMMVVTPVALAVAADLRDGGR